MSSIPTDKGTWASDTKSSDLTRMSRVKADDMDEIKQSGAANLLRWERQQLFKRLEALNAEYETYCNLNAIYMREQDKTIERLRALHLERTKTTHKALTERDETIERLRGALEKIANKRWPPGRSKSLSETMDIAMQALKENNPIQKDGQPVVLDDNI
jgi:hypothetical protein